MTSKERILIAMKNGQPDMVPVSPDISNMIPCRLTGKPFWDIYLYQNPPLWKAYIDAVRYFGFDGILEDWTWASDFRLEGQPEPPKRVIVEEREDRIVTQTYEEINGKKFWSPEVFVYRKYDPPCMVEPNKIGLPKEPKKYWSIEGVKEWVKGEELLSLILDYMGDDGVVGGIGCGGLLIVGNEEQVYEYNDDPGKTYQRAEQAEKEAQKQMERILKLERKPHVVECGASGCMIFQNKKMLRELGLPILKNTTRFFKGTDILTKVHCCGPEKDLVEMAANETDLNLIDPLEIPPMGNCILSELKARFGKKIALKGNLHTTEVMLKGSAKDVEEASKKAIDDAREGGGFILSTGDQCGRDTPEENIFKMIEVARTYGKY